jgi:hypothetical protein
MITAKLERASYYCIMRPSVHGHHAIPRLDQIMTDTGHPQFPATLGCANMKRCLSKAYLVPLNSGSVEEEPLLVSKGTTGRVWKPWWSGLPPPVAGSLRNSR